MSPNRGASPLDGQSPSSLPRGPLVVLLTAQASAQAIATVEAELARLGAGCRRLDGLGRVALEARPLGLPWPADVSARLHALGAVENVLGAPSPHPRLDAAPRPVVLGDGTAGRPRVLLGGEELILGAGPCAIDAHVDAAAHLARTAGARLLRGGAWKPRTSPYGFQGGTHDALAALRAAGDAQGLPIVVEVVDERSLEAALPVVDLLQIGARNGQSYALLRTVGATARPVLLKRSPGATVEEWLLAAEHLLVAGCPALVLCERGIRTFENGTRYTLDVAAVALARAATPAPVFVDPSHPAGVRGLVAPLALAALAAGADGLLVETHPDPGQARSDAAQALGPADLHALAQRMAPLATALGRRFSPPPTGGQVTYHEPPSQDDDGLRRARA